MFYAISGDYQLENIADSVLKDGDDIARRVDHYWRDVFASVGSDACTLKYHVLAEFVKAMLVITHGNSDIDRSFSYSGHSITSKRVAFNETSVNGLRSTRAV